MRADQVSSAPRRETANSPTLIYEIPERNGAAHRRIAGIDVLHREA